MDSNNNTTVSSSCPNHQWYMDAGHVLDFIAFRTLVYFYFFFGLFFYSICLIAFHIRTKHEEGYVYQLINIIFEILVIICMTITIVGNNVLGKPLFSDHPSPIWYRSCYVCMFTSAYLIPVLSSVSIIMSEIFTFCMSVDRLYALIKPFKYKSSNIQRNRTVGVVVCILVALSCGTFQAFRFNVGSTRAGDVILYQVESNTKFISSFAGIFFNLLLVVVRCTSLVALYVCNFAMILALKKQTRTIKSMLQGNDSSVTRKEKALRQLTLLSIVQSCRVTLECTALSVLNLFALGDPISLACKNPFYLPLGTVAIEMLGLWDIVVIFIVDDKVRNVFYRFIRCKKLTNNTVEPIINSFR